MKFLYWLLGIVAVLLCGRVVLEVTGYILVSGATDDVVEAIVTDRRSEQRLYRLPGGYFFGIPGLEGEVEIRCRDGSAHRHGYVTASMSTRVKVIGSRPCRLADA